MKSKNSTIFAFHITLRRTHLKYIYQAFTKPTFSLFFVLMLSSYIYRGIVFNAATPYTYVPVQHTIFIHGIHYKYSGIPPPTNENQVVGLS